MAHDTLPQKKVAARSSGSAALDLRLNNGDIVVMHGADIQKYFEVRAIRNLLLVIFTDYITAWVEPGGTALRLNM